MDLSTSLHTRELSEVISWFDDNFGNYLSRRIKTIKDTETTNPFYRFYTQQAFALELSIEKIRRLNRKFRALPNDSSTAAGYQFATMAKRVHAQLRPAEATRFMGNIRGSFQVDSGLRPIAYELAMIAHIANKGFSLECPDLSNGVGYRPDIFARRGEEEIEIECKTTSLDKGRKVHIKDLCQVAKNLVPIFDACLRDGGVHLATIEVPNRLVSREPEISGVKVALEKAILASGEYSNAFASVRYRSPQVTSRNAGLASGNNRDDYFRNLFKLEFGINDGLILTRARPEFGAFSILARSAAPEAIFDAFIAEAKDAADQCSGRIPAVVAMQLPDLSEQQMDTLVRGPSGLHLIADALFRDGRRNHVDSIVFTSNAILTATDLMNISRVGGPGAIIHNPNPAYPSVAARSLFSKVR